MLLAWGRRRGAHSTDAAAIAREGTCERPIEQLTAIASQKHQIAVVPNSSRRAVVPENDRLTRFRRRWRLRDALRAKGDLLPRLHTSAARAVATEIVSL